MQTKRALLIRMGSYDMTQALPRAAGVLSELGYEITILSMDTNGTKPKKERVKDWDIFWYAHRYKSGNKISFFWAWVCWWFWVIRKIYTGNYDIVQASNLESIIPCIIIKQVKKFNLIFDVRDPWGMTFSDTKSLFAIIFRRLEQWAACRVDGMVLSQGILEDTAIYFGKKTAAQTPVVQVLNVPERDLGQNVSLPQADVIRINFSGHISYLRNAQAFIDLAKANADILIDVVGDIRDLKLKNELQLLPNINIYGRVSFEEAISLISLANIVSVCYDTDTQVAIVSSANKMFESMMMSRPYLASKGAYPGLVAEEYEVGWAIEYGNSYELIKLVDYLISHPDEIIKKSQNGRKTYIETFNWISQKNKLKLFYEQVSDKKVCLFTNAEGWSNILRDA